MTGFAPPPWRSRGTLCVTDFLVPAGELPPTASPPLRVAGHAIVGVAFARQEPGGDPACGELVTAVAGHPRARTDDQPGLPASARELFRARLRPLRAEWDFAPDGPLAWLRGGDPVVSFALSDARLIFGARDVTLSSPDASDP